MTYAIAIPLGDWSNAEFADVFTFDPPIGNGFHPNVPILRHPDTEELLIIIKQSFPEGVIFLNEMEPQQPEDPIVTHPPGESPTFLLYVVPAGQEEITVPVIHNVGFPTGGIILWEP
jgi:hypothetical protein